MAFTHLHAVVRQVRRLAGVPAGGEPTDRELLRAFAARREAEAFDRLLCRHGPMVWGVCRRVLPHEDAEDAFQATFLVLARKAGAVRWRDSAAGWLYEVARRVAESARRTAARRSAAERRAAEGRAEAVAVPQDSSDEAAVLAEELARLPEKYRAPVVLCYLEGLSHPEAARQLGWPVGTVKGRLARAREALRRRLARRGVTVPAAAVAALLAGQASEAAPGRLAEATLRLALLVAAGTTAPASVAPLAEGVLRQMHSGRVKVLAALALGLCLGGAGIGMAARQPADKEGQGPAVPAEAEPGGRVARVPADPAEPPLPAGAIARLGSRRLRHGTFISFLAFTPDGRSLVSAADDLRVWDAATGREVRRFGGGSGKYVYAAALSPDGSLVATLDFNGKNLQATLWESATGRASREIDLPGRRAISGRTKLRFSPDGKRLAFCGMGPRIELLDVAAGKVEASWDAVSKPLIDGLFSRDRKERVWDAVFTPDGKRLISGGNDKVIHVWDAATGKPLRQIGADLDEVCRLALSADGQLLASVSCHFVGDQGGAGYWPPDPFVRVWDVAAGKELATLRLPPRTVDVDGQTNGVGAICFSPDGKTLIASGMDGSLRLWDPRTGKERRCLPDAAGSCLAFSPDGARLAVAEGGRSIHVRDLKSGEDLLPVTGHSGSVSACALSPDGRVVVTAGSDWVIRTWDAGSGRELRRLPGNEQGVLALALSDRGRTVLSAGADRTIRARDVATGQELRRYPVPVAGFPDAVQKWAFSPGGRLLAAVGGDKTVRLLDTASGKEVRRLEGCQICGAAFVDGGRTLVGWARDWTFHVWDTVSGERIRTFPADDRVTSPNRIMWLYAATASPDGRLVVTAHQDGTLVLKQTSSGREVLRWKGEGPSLSPLAFSPDGRTLARSSGSDFAIVLFETATGRERLRLVGHEGGVCSLTFSADGQRLVSGSHDTTALVWNLTGPLDGKPDAPLSPADLDARWADLAGDDAARAYRAIRALAARPEDSVPYLRKALPRAAPVDEGRVNRLIAGLDSERFAEREKSADELERLGDAVVPALRTALGGKPSAETERRLRALLEHYDREEIEPSIGRLREMRALEALELAGTPTARSVLQDLARGAAAARRTRDAKAALARMNPDALGGTP